MLIWRFGLIPGKDPKLKPGEHFWLFFWRKRAVYLVHLSTISLLGVDQSFFWGYHSTFLYESAKKNSSQPLSRR